MDGLAIAAALREIGTALEGGWVRAIHQPIRGTFILRIFSDAKHRLLLSPRDAAIHLTRLELPNPGQPSTFVMQLRKHLKGGRVVSVSQHGWDRIVELEIERRSGSRSTRYALIAELTGLRGGLVLTHGCRVLGASRHDVRNPIGATYAPLPPQAKTDPRRLTVEAMRTLLESDDPVRAITRSIDGVGRGTVEDLQARIAGRRSGAEAASKMLQAVNELLQHVEHPAPHVDRANRRAAFYRLPPPAEAVEAFSVALDEVANLYGTEDAAGSDEARALRRAIERHRRTATKLRDWLDASAEADRIQALADLVMIHHRDIPPKAEEAVLVDPATEESVVVHLQPALSGVENAQRLYERAKRLRRGIPHVTSRLCRIERELTRLERAEKTFHATGAIEADVAPLLRGRPASPKRPPPRGGFRSERIEGFTIWIGRNAADNDRILRAAASTDVWMHAEGHPGSHVIVRRGTVAEIPQAVLVHAARLAASSSKARTEKRVSVTVAEVRHVRKPKGAPAGLVHVRLADTLTVEPMREDE